MRRQLELRCQQAVTDGQLPADTDCSALAAMILSMSRGVAVLHRGYGNLEVAKQAISSMLNAIIGR